MTESVSFTVRIARWPDDSLAIREVREAVFIVEQRVAANLEWDGLDEVCTHALAVTDDGRPVGTGRLAADGKIGRMAVIREFRGYGIGEAILERLLEVARANRMPRCYLYSQTHALGFYARHGFVARGPEFDEADIPHREMVLEAVS